jgi:hypothetical protein
MVKARQHLWWQFVFLGLALLSVRPLLAEGGDPPARVGRLGYLEGTVSVQPAGVNQWNQAQANYPISTGDRLYTDQDGRDEIGIGNIVVRMWHSTDLTLTNLSDQLTQLGLAQGTIRVRTFGLPPGQQVEVDTPNGAIVVTQPGDIRVDSYEGDGGTQVTVNTGAVQVSGPNLLQNIAQGQAVRLMGSNPVQLQPVAMPGLDQFDTWSVQRDHHIEDARSAQYVSRDMPGYDDLDEYGNWDPNTEYGPVWYPNEEPAGWVPYRMGHWVWTGPWGWTWVDNEPWGWAPFHYGRWAFIGARWGWVPGPMAVMPVWSPALVAFAGGGGFGVGFGFGGGLAAWFPLGVGEPFIPWYHCGPGYIREVNMTNIDIRRIHNVTIVNNYNNFVRNTNNFNNIQRVNFNYANRDRAFTAAPSRAFASGLPINRNLARVTPSQIRSAQVIAHPSIQPTERSIVPHPVARALPVSNMRPTLLTRGGREAQAVPGARSQAVPYRPLTTANAARPGATINGNVPGGNRFGTPTNRAGAGQSVNRPMYQAARPSAPGEGNAARPLITRNGSTVMPGRAASPASNGQTFGNRAAPQSGNFGRANSNMTGANSRGYAGSVPSNTGRQGMSSEQPRPLVYRNETPPAQPSFQQQQRGLARDPGRPLDPQQRENLSSGRMAGPSQDREYLPHANQVQPQYNSAPRGGFSAPRGGFSEPRGGFSGGGHGDSSAPRGGGGGGHHGR